MVVVLLAGCTSSLYSDSYHPIDENGFGYRDSFSGPGNEFQVESISERHFAETEMIALHRVNELCEGKFSVSSVVTEIIVTADGKNSKMPSQSKIIAKCVE